MLKDEYQKRFGDFAEQRQHEDEAASLVSVPPAESVQRPAIRELDAQQIGGIEWDTQKRLAVRIEIEYDDGLISFAEGDHANEIFRLIKSSVAIARSSEIPLPRPGRMRVGVLHGE
jgi:hypothetical protein